MPFWNNTSITNNISNNISSNNHSSSDSSNNGNNIDNINVIINDNDNVSELHVDALLDNEYRKLIEETYAKSTNINFRIDAKINNIYYNNERHPNIYNFNEFYERYKSFGLRSRYTCIANDIDSFECIVCCEIVMNGKACNLNDNWEFTKVNVGVYNHFINQNRNSEHARKQSSLAWIDGRKEDQRYMNCIFLCCKSK